MIRAMLRRLIFYLLIALLAACGPGRLPDTVAITIASDGERQTIDLPPGQTVRDALRTASVTLGELDRVRPPETALLQVNQTITVTRVVQQTDFITQTLPFETQIVRDATIPEGQTRLQAGRNGTLQITYRLTYEDGVLIERNELSRDVIEPPTPEVMLVGIQGAFGTVPVSGTIVYLSNQNAFIMRDVSGNKRPLTTDGDLDGRVLSLSRDGRWLLYTRAVSTTFNSLWIMDTTLAKPEPRALNLTGILWADFAPDGQSIAWSRGDPAPGLPGWKALNDLSIAPITNGRPGTRREIVKASSSQQYAWWGTAYAWSPDSKWIAFANTEAIGVISPTARLTKTQVLQTFAAYDTRSTWAWTPVPAWSSDSRFVIAAVHAASPGGEPPEDSPVFNMMTLGISPTVRVRLATNTGMWAVPFALPANGPIVFGVADTPYASEASRYRLDSMDRDGSNRTPLFPAAEAVGLDGLPEFTASPDGRNLLIIYQGDLYSLNLSTNLARRLTADGTISRPRWAR
jgi:Tol biopolymer transport system component